MKAIMVDEQKLIRAFFENIIKIRTFILFCLEILIFYLKVEDNTFKKKLECIKMRPPGFEPGSTACFRS